MLHESTSNQICLRNQKYRSYLHGLGCRHPHRSFHGKEKKGENMELLHDLLPRYVFVYMEKEMENFEVISKIHGVIQCLGTENGKVELTHLDYDFTMVLYNESC
jgi:transcription antitermination factor NusG